VRRIRETIREPIEADGEEIVVIASIGISAFPVDGSAAEQLVTASATAMNCAKSNGRDRYQFYDSSMNARAFERLSLENNLRKALQDDQFEMYFQPKVSIATGRVVAAEALVKWNHTDLGLISPLEFIPIAEETGLIMPLGTWILRESCARESVVNRRLRTTKSGD
jgi:predicted signal transduction protein with EAL and GGDEF domain